MAIPNTFSNFLVNLYQQSIKDNDLEILSSVEKKDKDLLLRIENFRCNKMTEAERVLNSTESILESIKTNTMIRANFRKDPTKQSVHENAQIDWIKENLYSDAVKLPAGINGVCLSKNKFYEIKSKTRPSDATKTFDIHVPSKKLYGVLKYTSCPGGAQDNQYTDVKQFINQAVGYLNENPTAEEIFAFYLDGLYYTPDKIKTLKDMIPQPHKEKITITNCDSIRPNIS
jgi:hypothetical protein